MTKNLNIKRMVIDMIDYNPVICRVIEIARAFFFLNWVSIYRMASSSYSFRKACQEPWLKSSPISHLVFLSRLLNTYDRLFYWAILWRLIEALGLQRVEFLSDPWVILAKSVSFLDFDNAFQFQCKWSKNNKKSPF